MTSTRKPHADGDGPSLDGSVPRAHENGAVVSLLDEDAELRDAVPEADHATARRATAVRVVELPGGEVESSLAERAPLGTMVLSGALVREVQLDRHCLPELLGPGDMLEGPADEVVTSLGASERVLVLKPARVGILPTSLLLAQARWPALGAVLRRRRHRQRHRLALYGLVCQLPRTEDRLLTLFWHFAEDWGTVTADGVSLPFSFTHETLGAWTGTRRPTVTLGLGVLRDEGLVDRAPEGGWLLNPAGRDRVGARELDQPTVLDRAARARERAASAREPSKATRAQSQQAMRQSAKLRAEAGAAGDQRASKRPKTSG